MRTSTLFFALAMLFSTFCRTASGDLTIEMLQIGNDVVVTSSGTVDTTNLELVSVSGGFGGVLQPDSNANSLNAFVQTGLPASHCIQVDLYFNTNFEPFVGPTSFGFETRFSTADTGFGDLHGFFANQVDPSVGLPPHVIVPEGYVSGEFLSSVMTFQDRSFADLGVTEGIYNWSFQGNEITLVIVVALGLPPTLGDCNQDGVVDFSDIPAFIEVLSSGSFLYEADCNEDGVVDFADIPAFIQILIAS